MSLDTSMTSHYCNKHCLEKRFDVDDDYEDKSDECRVILKVFQII